MLSEWEGHTLSHLSITASLASSSCLSAHAYRAHVGLSFKCATLPCNAKGAAVQTKTSIRFVDDRGGLAIGGGNWHLTRRVMGEEEQQKVLCLTTSHPLDPAVCMQDFFQKH